jgi:hypothetical protein
MANEEKAERPPLGLPAGEGGEPPEAGAGSPGIDAALSDYIVQIKSAPQHQWVGAITGSYFVNPYPGSAVFANRHFLFEQEFEHVRGFQVEGSWVDAQTEEHEKTRELITEKIAVLAEKKDIIEARDQTIATLTKQIEDLQRRLESTMADLATARELEECSKQVCDKVRSESEETRDALTRELADLRRYLSKFAPYKRFFRVTFGSLCFFAVSLVIDFAFKVRIVEPFWGVVGAGFSAAMLLVVYFGMKDAEDPPPSGRKN